MISQIISGVVIALVSFALGYFLFVVQRKEAIRLELFRRRLDAYDKIMKFILKLDEEVIARKFSVNKDQIEKYVSDIYNLTWPKMHYLSKEVHTMLDPQLINWFDSLPEKAGEFEWQCENIKLQILKETGGYIITPKEMEKIIGRRRKTEIIS